MSDIHEWLDGLGLGHYAEVFETNDIDPEAVAYLTEAQFDKLGVSIGHAVKMRNAAIAALQDTGAADAPAPEVQQPGRPQPASPDAERRQLTVMFCDLVGSTALSARLDPEDLREVMRAYQDACAGAIDRFGGHIAQTLGDGLMVYFGYPVAHEDDAQRAVRAGLDIVGVVAELSARLEAEQNVAVDVRVGVHTGLVVAGEVGGADTRGDMAVVGETPNIAARIEGLAAPGTVVVGDRTRRLVGDVFDFDDLGSHHLKGLSAPMSLYRARAERVADSRFEAMHPAGLTPFVGRDEEISLLLGRWAAAKGGEGQVVLLEGEPGIGKSRITGTFRDLIGRDGYTRVQYQCSPFFSNTAFYPIITQLERAARFDAADDPSARLDKLEALIGADDPEALALIGNLLSLPVDRYPAIEMSPQRQKERIIEVLVAQLDKLAGQAPILLVFEDVHWIDPTSREALDQVIGAITAQPILVIVTFRPEFEPQWGAHSHVTLHSLNRLGKRQSGLLVEQVTGDKQLPDLLRDQIVIKTDGVPLFIEELTKAVLESDIVVDAGDHYALSGSVDEIAIPDTLHDSLMARLDKLIPVKEVAQIGAAIGREFSYQLMAALSPMGTDDLDAALDKLVDSQLVHRRGAPPHAVYIFKHALVQDAAYDSLLKRDRQDLHKQIADVLLDNFPDVADTEPELLFHHLSSAGLIEPAIPHAIKAGQLATARGAPESAISQLSAGLDLIDELEPSPGRDELELDLRLELGTAYIFAHGWAYGEVKPNYDRCRDLVALSPDQQKAFNATLGLFYYFNVISMRDEADAIADELLEMANRSGDHQQLLLTYQARGQTHWHRARYAEAIPTLDRSASYYDIERDPALAQVWGGDFLCMDLGFGAICEGILGHLDRALERALESDAHARKLGQPIILCNSRTFFLPVLQMRGEHEKFLELATEVLDLAVENGLGIYVVWMNMFIASGHYGLGNPEQAVAIFDEAVAAADMVGAKAMRGYGVAFVASAYAEIGEGERGLALVDETISNCRLGGDYNFDAGLHITRADLKRRCELGDLGESDLLKALDLARTQSAKYLELRATTELAKLLRLQNKVREARALLAPVYGWFTEGLDTRHLKDAKALLDELG